MAPLFDELLPMSAVTANSGNVAFASDALFLCDDFYAKRAIDLTSEIVTRFKSGVHLEEMQKVTFFQYMNNDKF